MNKKDPTTTPKRNSKEEVLKKVMQNQLLRKTKIEKSKMKNISDEEIPDKQKQLETYIDYCQELREAYDVKHEEVMWYTSIISDIRKNVFRIVKANTVISGENRNYLLGVIEYIMTLDIDPKRREELEKMKQQQTEWIDQTQTNLLDLLDEVFDEESGLDFGLVNTDLIQQGDDIMDPTVSQVGGK